VARKSIATVALFISCALITSGCAIGFDAPTNQQQPSGNGRTANVGAIEVRGATIVIDPKKPGHASFLGTIINTADTQDTLVALQVEPVAGTGISTNIDLPKQQPAQIGFDSVLRLGFQVKNGVRAGDYVKIRLIFKNNDMIEMSLLVSNNDGIYQGVTVP